MVLLDARVEGVALQPPALCRRGSIRSWRLRCSLSFRLRREFLRDTILPCVWPATHVPAFGLGWYIHGCGCSHFQSQGLLFISGRDCGGNGVDGEAHGWRTANDSGFGLLRQFVARAPPQPPHHLPTPSHTPPHTAPH